MYLTGKSSGQSANMRLLAQFYIQLFYRSLFGICFLPFGLLGNKMKISEMTKFLLK